jgi:predicted ATP-dependent serine protease
MQLGIKTTTTLRRASDIKISDDFYNRVKTGEEQLDEIFGDGLMKGTAITLTAVAGGGKTTFLLQLLERLEQNDYSTAYLSGEESAEQLAFNCKRLNVRNVLIGNVTDVDEICEIMQSNNVVVIDSFPSITTKEQMSSTERIKYILKRIITTAKETKCIVFFIMHLTKDGKLKGSTLIPHSVDVNISIQKVKDSSTIRVIGCYKNRFGSTGEYPADLTGTGYIFGVELPEEKKHSVGAERLLNLKELVSNVSEVDRNDIEDACDCSSQVAYQIIKKAMREGWLLKNKNGKEIKYVLAR